MSKLNWDQVGEKEYYTGVDKTVLFPFDNSTKKYGTGVAWSGVTAINENPSGAEPTDLYADNQKYLTMRSKEEFGATLESYMYPPEFEECNGRKKVAGLLITQQTRKAFGLAYRNYIGNDTEYEDYGYELHFVYGATASPASRSHGTVNESPEAETLSHEISTVPEDTGISGMKPTAHVIIRSTDPDVTQEKLSAIENMIWGTDETDPKLPSVAELLAILDPTTYGSGTSSTTPASDPVEGGVG